MNHIRRHQPLRRRRRAVAVIARLLVSTAGCAAAALHHATARHPRPYHTLALNGAAWICDLLLGNNFFACFATVLCGFRCGASSRHVTMPPKQKQREGNFTSFANAT